MKIKLKEFLRPDWKKVLITVLILGITLLYKYEPPVSDAYIVDHGLPLGFVEGFQGAKTGQVDTLHYSVLPIQLVLDIIAWYLISCLILSFVNKKGEKH